MSLKRVDGKLCKAAQWGSVLTVSQVSERGRPRWAPRALFSIAFLLSLITSPLVSAVPLKSVHAMKDKQVMRAHFLTDSRHCQRLPYISNLVFLGTEGSWDERVGTPCRRDINFGKDDFERREDPLVQVSLNRTSKKKRRCIVQSAKWKKEERTVSRAVLTIIFIYYIYFFPFKF